MFKKLENIREYKKKKKMKFIDFKTSIDSFYQFFFRKN